MSGTRRVPGDVLVHLRRARDHLERPAPDYLIEAMVRVDLG